MQTIIFYLTPFFSDHVLRKLGLKNPSNLPKVLNDNLLAKAIHNYLVKKNSIKFNFKLKVCMIL